MNQTAALEQWWASLEEDRRREALDIEPGDFLSEVVALDLMLYGVHVPDVAVAWDVEGVLARVTVHVQPAVLTEFLAGVRARR
ncbi:hypothetical protein [Kineococcus auxinigenes]|uniref:hypothetical protein n=1 Tax=unclassified Kineococcus TaxID=2621656 RepID=UPI003D7EFB54